MNIDEFNDGLDRWGSRTERWPEPDRSAATALLEQSEAARRQLAQAELADQLLAADHHPAPHHLRQQILQQLEGDDMVQRLADWFAAALWKPVLAAACMLALGFSIGFGGAGERPPDNELHQVSLLTFSYDYQEIDDAL